MKSSPFHSPALRGLLALVLLGICPGLAHATRDLLDPLKNKLSLVW